MLFLNPEIGIDPATFGEGVELWETIHGLASLSRATTESTEQAVLPKSLMPIGEYYGSSPRLTGFHLVHQEVVPRLANTLPLQEAHIRVIHPHLYEECKANGFKFTESRRRAIAAEIQPQIDGSPNGSIALRRSFHVPGAKKIPGGPTANELHSADGAVTKLEEMFRWAHEQGLDTHEGAEITCFVQDWLDLDLLAAQGDVSKLTAGGDAIIETVNPDGGIIIRIRVCLGENSAVNLGHPEIDEYRVLYMPPSKEFPAGTSRIITTKITPQKNVMLLQRSTPPPAELQAVKLTDNRVDSEIYRVHIDHTTGIAQLLLSDPDIHRIALASGILYHSQKTPFKLEFTKSQWPKPSGNLTSIAILEAIPWPIPEINGQTQNLHSGILRANISTIADIIELQKHLREFHEDEPLIHLNPAFILQINTRLGRKMLERLKQIGRRLTIVAQLSDTDHKVNELSEAHTVHPIQTTLLDTGIRYDIFQKGTIRWAKRSERQKGRIRKLSRMMTIQQAIAEGRQSPDDIGGKASGLARLIENGFNTPAFSITLTKSFFEELIQVNGIQKLIVEANNSRSIRHLTRVFGEILEKINSIPNIRPITNGLKAACKNIDQADKEDVIPHEVSVRSNANFEDRRGAPFAGKLETVPHVDVRNTEMVRNAILKVIRSYFNPQNARAIFDDFRASDRKDVLFHLNGSVLFHPMYRAHSSGTLFGREKAGQRRHNIVVINANRGTGGGVESTPNRESLTVKYDTDLRRFEGITHHTEGNVDDAIEPDQLYDTPNHRRILTYKEAKMAIVLAEYMTDQLHSAQDAEWLITPSDKIIFMQARDI